jgi:hypothetical protein
LVYIEIPSLSKDMALLALLACVRCAVLREREVVASMTRQIRGALFCPMDQAVILLYITVASNTGIRLCWSVVRPLSKAEPLHLVCCVLATSAPVTCHICMEYWKQYGPPGEFSVMKRGLDLGRRARLLAADSCPKTTHLDPCRRNFHLPHFAGHFLVKLNALCLLRLCFMDQDGLMRTRTR